MDEERAIADRLSSYSDAVAAFSVVNAFGFLVAVAEIDTRCSLVESRAIVIATLVILQAIYAGAIIGLRHTEQSLREGTESSARVTELRKGFYYGRLIIVAVVSVMITLISWFALGGDSCSVA